MRLFVSSVLTLCIMSQALAQTKDDLSSVKKIEVYGLAEEEVTPDELYFSITLKEYRADGKQKTTIDELERGLNTAVKKIGVKEEDFRIEDVSAYNYDWYRKKKPQREEFLASKEYLIKFSNLNQINELLGSLDAKGIQSTNVDRYEHSQIEQYRKNLKVKALKNAKEKATYLLQGIDEAIGGVLEVQEIDTEGGQPPVHYLEARSMAMASAEMDEAAPAIDFQKIKLSFRVRAVFEIQ